ncbi:MAG TPA: hypothetical protein VG518_05000 [Solirubrobacterales bacterium]|nr:hypothetical protein [Solirubrobacterales bacterium]
MNALESPPAPEPIASARLSTPPEWRVLNLENLEDRDWASAKLAAHLPEGNESQAAKLADLTAGAPGSGIVFAAMCLPGEGESLDLSTVTLSLQHPASQTREGDAVEGEAAIQSSSVEDWTEAPGVQTPAGPSQNAALLPAGPAVREESFEILEVGSGLNPMPVFSIEYAVSLPGECVAVLTFTTIAPSDTDALRAQFAEIAATLVFS